MLIIDYKNKFTVDVERTSEMMDRDEFLSIIDYFKKIYLFFDPSTKQWTIDEKRIDEVCMWFDRVNYEYKLTDSAAQRVNELGKQYNIETTFFRNRSLDYSIYNEGVKPKDFQIQDINWSLRRTNYLDSDDAGLGKSFINISVAAQNYKEGLIDSLIVVCPSGMTFHWKYEILKFVNVFVEDDIQIVLNDDKFQPFDDFKDKKILIISNNTKVFADAILSYKKGFKFGSSLKNIRWNSYNLDIKKQWDKKNIMLIADECHAFQHSTSIRTKALKCIKKNFAWRSLLSATPNINHFESIYPQLNILDSSLIPFSENAFKLYISDEIGDKYGIYNIVKYNTKNILSLKSKWANNFRQRLKEDVPEMKAKRIMEEVYFDLTHDQKKIYQAIVEQELAVLQEEYNTITWKLLMSKFHLISEVFDNPNLLKARQYSNPILEKLLKKWSMDDDPKFTALKEKLEDYIENRNEKVVIFDYRPSTLDELNERLKKYNPAIIHGSLEGIKSKEIDRKEKEDKFNNDPSCKLILLSSLTSSAGLNLQKSCHRIIVYSMPFDGVSFRQLVDRTTRIDSKEDSIVEIFFYPRTLDNLRVQRNLGRIEYNDSMGKEVDQSTLDRLLKGLV